MSKTATMKYCDTHEKEYIGKECSICWVERIAEEHRIRKEAEKQAKEEARKQRLEEAAKQHEAVPVRLPCQNGCSCVWAKDTQSDKITCLWVGGCVKLHA